MKIAIVLLSKDGYYLGPNGELPKRPSWDKEFITLLAEGKTVLCSENTFKTLPPSIKKVAAGITTNPEDDWQVNFGIKTYNEISDYFLIITSTEDLDGGKKFDMSRIRENYAPWVFPLNPQMQFYVSNKHLDRYF